MRGTFTATHYTMGLPTEGLLMVPNALPMELRRTWVRTSFDIHTLIHAPTIAPIAVIVSG